MGISKVVKLTLVLVASRVWVGDAFQHVVAPFRSRPSTANSVDARKSSTTGGADRRFPGSSSSSSLKVAEVPSLDVVALVVGQENYGLAAVAVGEALWSFLEAPSFDHAKILVAPALATALLVFVSGPMVTSGNLESVGLGLGVATGVSVLLMLSYIARLIAPYSPSPKEIAALGLLFAVAGFFSFAQNLFVDGFLVLPSLPSLPSLPGIELPSLPSIDLPSAPTIGATLDPPVADSPPPPVVSTPPVDPAPSVPLGPPPAPIVEPPAPPLGSATSTPLESPPPSVPLSSTPAPQSDSLPAPIVSAAPQDPPPAQFGA